MKGFVREFVVKFIEDDTMTLAASLAFWAALSLAPMVVIFLTVTSSLSLHLQQVFVAEADKLVGDKGGLAVQMIVDSANTRAGFSGISGLFSVITLIVSASAVFGELRSSLTRIIFDNKSDADADESDWVIVLHYLEIRILNIGLFLIFTVVLVGSLLLNFALSLYKPLGDVIAIHLMNLAVTGLLYTILFSFVYRYVPTKPVQWRQACVAGVITMVLFLGGKEIIGLYLGHSLLGSWYGAIGSVIVLLAWIFYSALVIFSGAQISVLLERRFSQKNSSLKTS